MFQVQISFNGDIGNTWTLRSQGWVRLVQFQKNSNEPLISFVVVVILSHRFKTLSWSFTLKSHSMEGLSYWCYSKKMNPRQFLITGSYPCQEVSGSNLTQQRSSLSGLQESGLSNSRTPRWACGKTYIECMSYHRSQNKVERGRAILKGKAD